VGRLSFASRAGGAKKCRSAGDGAFHPGSAVPFRRRAVAACRCTGLLRAPVSLAVRLSEPSEARPAVLFSRSQKAWVFLVEMCEDPRVAAHLSRLKQQIAVAMLKWRLCGLSLLALKLKLKLSDAGLS
jgi:hypothetical protein